MRTPTLSNPPQKCVFDESLKSHVDAIKTSISEGCSRLIPQPGQRAGCMHQQLRHRSPWLSSPLSGHLVSTSAAVWRTNISALSASCVLCCSFRRLSLYNSGHHRNCVAMTKPQRTLMLFLLMIIIVPHADECLTLDYISKMQTGNNCFILGQMMKMSFHYCFSM